LRVLDQLESALSLLSQNPELGRSREDLCQDKEILFWPVGPSMIAYRVEEKRLEILFLERASRNWASFFEQFTKNPLLLTQ